MIWKTHPKYRNYEVSDTGLIRGKQRKVTLKSRYNKSNKLSVSIHSKEGFLVQKLVGEMVLETFRGRNRHGHNSFINLDGNSENNSLENLTWTRFKYKKEYPVIQIDSTGKIVRKWDSIEQACLEEGYVLSSILACCDNKLKSHSGFHWIFNTGNNKYLTIKVKELRVSNGTSELVFNSTLDAYYHFNENMVTLATYESFYNSVIAVKNKKNKTYLGYGWKEKSIVKKIEIYG